MPVELPVTFLGGPCCITVLNVGQHLSLESLLRYQLSATLNPASTMVSFVRFAKLGKYPYNSFAMLAPLPSRRCRGS
jgi:hypothetical protein